jgi:hypothetical protein
LRICVLSSGAKKPLRKMPLASAQSNERAAEKNEDRNRFWNYSSVVAAAADRGNYPLVNFEAPDGRVRDWFPSLLAVSGDKRVYGWEAVEQQGKPGWTIVRSVKRWLKDAGPCSGRYCRPAAQCVSPDDRNDDGLAARAHGQIHLGRRQIRQAPSDAWCAGERQQQPAISNAGGGPGGGLRGAWAVERAVGRRG